MNDTGSEKKTALRWGVEKRMEFIEFRLLWEGGINRSDIVEQFGVSAPQASNDLSQYKDAAPDNIEYDLSVKRYFASAKFKPLFLRPDSDRYLSQLKLIADGMVSAQETWLSIIPSIDSIPVPHRHVDIKILKPLVNAVRNKRALKVHYQSMSDNRPDPIWRWITPHAFANDGMRWHVRAFCHLGNEFKDFLLSRFLDIGEDAEPGAPSSQDHIWHESINVILIPNPKLSMNQRAIIANDYGMNNTRLIIPVRKAILYYFKKRLRLDVAEALDNPQEAPVVIENREVFDAALAEKNPKTAPLTISVSAP